MLWKYEDLAKLLSYSINHIDVETSVLGMGNWRFTGFYGEPNRTSRRRTWDLLRNLARDANMSWCVMGDLNNIVAQTDKRGGAPYQVGLLKVLMRH